jgi:hypothetical protein
MIMNASADENPTAFLVKMPRGEDRLGVFDTSLLG